MHVQNKCYKDIYNAKTGWKCIMVDSEYPETDGKIFSGVGGINTSYSLK
jgi:hypothetical protein